ncbi:PglZ domain-containing protein, partial [Leptospira bouyouniensis]
KEYSEWIESTNQHYQAICEKNGFLPSQSQQLQRFYFQYFLKPLTDLGKTAVFFVDAMRYEVGELLKTKLEENSLKPTIHAIYAELPTITSVGMNALVPTEMNGELEPLIDKDQKSIRGFKTGNRNVSSIDERRLILKEISKRHVEWINLEELHKNFKSNVSRAKSADLLVIHSLIIDKAGEEGFLDSGFDFFEDTISKIKISIEQLREIGYENFSIVSDHGFIQYDTSSEYSRSNSVIPSNFKGARRYVIQEDRINSQVYSRVDMSSIRYKSAPLDLVFLREPKIFKNAPANKGFFHGGNSMQERIIPVITLRSEKKIEDMPNNISYDIVAEIFLGKGRHRLDLQLNSKQEDVLFKQNQELLIELDSVENAKLRIISSNSLKFDNNEIIIKPNVKYTIEFEIVTSSKLVFQEKASVKIWSPILKSKILPWISQIKVPLSSSSFKNEDASEIETPNRNLSLPSELEVDVEIVLSALIKNPQKMLTEVGITRIFDDSRRSARAVRMFSNFLQNRGNELDFTIHIEHGAEGKIFRIGKK